MYVTINFLSCFNVDKAYLLDATWGVFELGLKVQAWHDGFCNNRKGHFMYFTQRAPYPKRALWACIVLEKGRWTFVRRTGGLGGRLDKGGGTLRPQITSPLLFPTTFCPFLI